LAAEFHAAWNLGNDDVSRRYLQADDAALTQARLFLARAIGQIIRNGLAIMGVEAVEEMK
jgi:arginyl-tRNA synthetase